MWRNRRLAHRDLGIALQPETAPLPEIAFDSIEQALASFQALLNQLEGHFNSGGTVEYSMIRLSVKADGLMYFLEKGLEAEASRGEP